MLVEDQAFQTADEEVGTADFVVEGAHVAQVCAELDGLTVVGLMEVLQFCHTLLLELVVV